MKTVAILIMMVLVTLVGDYLIKISSQKPAGLVTLSFIGGAISYGLSAVCWFYLVRSHSLTAIGVFYAAATIIISSGLGYFVFKEAFGLREALGVSLSIAAVMILSH